ncbi:hypothetical protein F8388_022260 [Cannabis sativa]|uniref:DUF4283 domain-containing protein n=1 Tax=Cannabis sativa TaxID=3483 RepID=A0A7J6E7X7_CANSA|nr:hypothetical protein F8388_022260 [Cannabis sativa]
MPHPIILPSGSQVPRLVFHAASSESPQLTARLYYFNNMHEEFNGPSVDVAVWFFWVIMASSSEVRELVDSLVAIHLEEEEQGAVAYDEEEEFDARWCLVVQLLSNIPVDFDAFQHRIAALWKPSHGMYVKQLQPNKFVFQFNHERDITHAIEGSPWTYNRVQVIIERLMPAMDLRALRLNTLDIWVQFRVQVKLNINVPLKRKMKLGRKGGEMFWVEADVGFCGSNQWPRTWPSPFPPE